MWSIMNFANALKEELLLTYIIFLSFRRIVKINLLFNSFVELLIINDVLTIKRTLSFKFASLSIILAFVSLEELSKS